MRKLSLNNNKQIKSVVRRLFVLLCIEVTPRIIRKSTAFLRWFLTVRRDNGAHAIKAGKARCDFVLKWVINGEPDTNDDLYQWCWDGKKIHYSIPPRMHWFLGFSKFSRRHKLAVITLLNFHRALYSKPVLDLKSIEDPLPDLLKVLRMCWELWSSPLWQVKPLWKRDLLGTFVYRPRLLNTMKGGPNHKHAQKGIVDDLSSLIEDGRLWYKWKLLYRGLSDTWGDHKYCTEFSTVLFSIADSLVGGSITPLRKKGVHSRLAALSDRSGKTRVIALGDYWTQCLLRPLHDHMFAILRSMQSVDGTFDQSRQRERVRKWTVQKGYKYSLDLSSATDRLPILIQGVVMCKVFTEMSWKLAVTWMSVLTDRDFHITSRTSRKLWSRSNQKTVRYRAGQPMGFYTSWASLALTHHALVWLAAHRAGWRGRFYRYALLGDDIVIFSRPVAREYRKIMSDLGVSISIPKSHVSKDFAEFGKALYLEGRDISPLSWSLIIPDKLYYFADSILLLKQLHERGVSLPFGKIPEAFGWMGEKQLTRLLFYVTWPYQEFYYKSDLVGWTSLDLGIRDFLAWRRAMSRDKTQAYADLFGSFKDKNWRNLWYVLPKYQELALKSLEHPVSRIWGGGEVTSFFHAGDNFITMGPVVTEESLFELKFRERPKGIQLKVPWTNLYSVKPAEIEVSGPESDDRSRHRRNANLVTRLADNKLSGEVMSWVLLCEQEGHPTSRA
jgi:hypothetical protein